MSRRKRNSAGNYFKNCITGTAQREHIHFVKFSFDLNKPGLTFSETCLRMNKVIPRIKGGLGNQLFCYAAAHRLFLFNNAELASRNQSIHSLVALSQNELTFQDRQFHKR